MALQVHQDVHDVDPIAPRQSVVGGVEAPVPLQHLGDPLDQLRASLLQPLPPLLDQTRVRRQALRPLLRRAGGHPVLRCLGRRVGRGDHHVEHLVEVAGDQEKPGARVVQRICADLAPSVTPRQRLILRLEHVPVAEYEILQVGVLQREGERQLIAGHRQPGTDREVRAHPGRDRGPAGVPVGARADPAHRGRHWVLQEPLKRRRIRAQVAAGDPGLQLGRHAPLHHGEALQAPGWRRGGDLGRLPPLQLAARGR
jgi:hypothetical protein